MYVYIIYVLFSSANLDILQRFSAVTAADNSRIRELSFRQNISGGSRARPMRVVYVETHTLI